MGAAANVSIGSRISTGSGSGRISKSGAGAGLELSTEREARRLTEARRAMVSDPVLRTAVAAAVGWLAVYAAATTATAGHPGGRRFVGEILALVPVGVATGLSALAARRTTGRRRRLWSLLVVSNALWLAGGLVWAGYDYVLRRSAPFPSLADALYLASYVVVSAAVLVGFRAGRSRRRLRGLLDAVVVGLGLGAAGWQLLIAPRLTTALSPADATSIAYPLLGVVIVLTLASVALAGRRYVAPPVWILVAAFTVSAFTDAGYTYLASLDAYVTGDWLNLGWQTEAVLLCVAAVCALRYHEGDGQLVPLGRDPATIPVLVAVAAALVVTLGDALRRGTSSIPVIAVAVVVAGLVVRFALTATDARRTAEQLAAALREEQRLAVTDGLTGLYNRRFFEEVLRLETERALRGDGRLALVVTDLDHFKHVNDAHGHQSGDVVLVEAAHRLRRTLRASDVLARYGGEEFVTILPDADRDTAFEIAERCRIALSGTPVPLPSGRAVTVTGSFGLAVLATEPGSAGPWDAAALLRRADRALYAAKDAGRNRVQLAPIDGEGSDDGAEAALGERVDVLAPLELLADLVDSRLARGERSSAMARWAGVVSDALGLEPVQRRRAVQAARLADIGAVVLGDALVSTPAPLTSPEVQVIRTHSQEGARLVLGVPGHEALAAIVRGHHERWDGRGYPDGIDGSRLPLETRIVSVIDAWSAMTAGRRHRPALPAARARAELLAGRWTQFDGDVVDVFLALEAAGLVGDVSEEDPAQGLVRG